MTSTSSQIIKTRETLIGEDKAITNEEFWRLQNDFLRTLHMSLPKSLKATFRKHAERAHYYALFRDMRVINCGEIHLTHMSDHSREVHQKRNLRVQLAAEQAKHSLPVDPNLTSWERWNLESQVLMKETYPYDYGCLLRTSAALRYLDSWGPFDTGFNVLRGIAKVCIKTEAMLEFLKAVENLDDYSKFANDNEGGKPDKSNPQGWSIFSPFGSLGLSTA